MSPPSPAPVALFDPSLSIKIVEVANKYAAPPDREIIRGPEYTVAGGPNSYHCSKIDTAWTQGFLPGMLWLLVERRRLRPSSVHPGYSDEHLIILARRWQASFEFLKRPSINHDQGFRFQLSFGRDYEITGDEHAKEVMLEAADSLVDRYKTGAGCIRSWDEMDSPDHPGKYTKENMDEHFIVIVDTMMNLDILYEATRLTGDPKYERIATQQAEKSSTTHVRKDGTTYHVVNFDQKTGKALEFMTAQGYADDSIWSRGQAWAICGYAHCAMRTGRDDFTAISRKLADVFVSLLPESGVPWWDFKAPQPCPYDASAGVIAARGMQILHQLLLPTDQTAAEAYLQKAHKLVGDTLRECATPAARWQDGKVNWGQGGWETILKHSTINGNPRASNRVMDHGLVYADYYLLEFGNEAIKLQKNLEGYKSSKEK